MHLLYFLSKENLVRLFMEAKRFEIAYGKSKLKTSDTMSLPYEKM